MLYLSSTSYRTFNGVGALKHNTPQQGLAKQGGVTFKWPFSSKVDDCEVYRKLHFSLSSFHILLYFKISIQSKMWHDQGNESDVGNIDFELQPKKGDKFLCFTLFLNVKNCSYLCNQMSDWDGIWIKM